jgi:cystathionine beta-lyase
MNMQFNFDDYPSIDRSNFVRYNPVFLKAIFGSTEVLPFWVADTDFKVLDKLSEALEARASLGLFGYETKSPKLKQALCDWYSSRYEIKLHPKKLLFMPTVNASIAAIVDEFSKIGDGVIIQPPVYQAFKGIIESQDREVVNNPLLKTGNHYQIDFDDLLAKAKNPANKIMILCSPHNPISRVWTEPELTKISQICSENNVMLIADEIHGDIVYPPHKYIGALNLYSGFSKNIIMVSSAGKTFGMPGLVDSFIYTPNAEYYKAIKSRIERFHLDKSNAFANTAWQIVYEHGNEWLDQMLAYIKGNVDYITEFLDQELPEIKLSEVSGTYQIWLDFRSLKMSNEELTIFLATEVGIALNQGFTYGPGGNGFMRMNIASPKSMIVKAMEQLKSAVMKLPSQ